MDKGVSDRKRVEAVLFASDRALTIREIARISGVREKTVKKMIESLNR